ncbi:MAG: hypothetical protein D6714_03785 [Bacteroidetes bacterium]|nr:MAG: hypothetical protein D6714_03785 [Bacteroidota bacterium]
MRIIGYVEHPVLKITVFKMDTKLSVKFETGLYEQTYKFRVQEGLENISDVQKLVDEGFINNVLEQMKAMHATRMQALERHRPPKGADEFDTIV